MLNTILCEVWTTAEIVAVCIVGSLILAMPICYNLFGAEYPKEDGTCGTETVWQRLMRKWFNKS